MTQTPAHPDIAPVDRAVAGRRGKYHRTVLRRPGTTRCGKSTRDFTIVLDVNQVADGDRCKVCWKDRL